MIRGHESVARRRQHPFAGHAPVLAAVSLCFSATIGGCGLLDLLAPDEGGPVFITGVEGLNTPAVTRAYLYQPAFTFPVAADDPTAGQAAGFYLHLATSQPELIQMRILGGADTAPVELLRVAPLSDAAIFSPTAWDLPSEAREVMRNGQGVFWLADSTGPDCRAGVALPDGWTAPSITLQVYSATTADGDPITPAGIELAHDFFYLAAIGDSVVWGNGLMEENKFSRLVTAEIQRRTGRCAILQVQAISGARIVPDPTDVVCRVQCNGEVQIASTSITTQVDLLEAPGALELILVDGCINDVSLTVILSSTTTTDALAGYVQSACYDEMRALLEKIRSTAPAAAVVVTGYYPILSTESTLPDVAQFFLVQDVTTDTSTAGAFDQVVANANTFYNLSTQALAAAIQDVATGGARIALADPGFGPSNAMFASDSLLWGLTSDRIQQEAADRGYSLYPEDPLASLRAGICFRGLAPDPLTCLYASVGHPNPAGARRYAETIIPLLTQLGVIPP